MVRVESTDNAEIAPIGSTWAWGSKNPPQGSVSATCADGDQFAVKVEGDTRRVMILEDPARDASRSAVTERAENED